MERVAEIIFKLDNGKEIKDSKELDEYAHLFPFDIKEKIKPVFISESANIPTWLDRCNIYVFQNGEYTVKHLPPATPFGMEMP